jgi:hypothetical protein
MYRRKQTPNASNLDSPKRRETEIDGEPERKTVEPQRRRFSVSNFPSTGGGLEEGRRGER